jgi:hypothetical protein
VKPIGDRTIFLTLVRAPGERSRARLLIDSIRTFAGGLSHTPVWVFAIGDMKLGIDDLMTADTQVFQLDVADSVGHYPFASKVCACVQAEEMCSPSVRSLIWIDAGCLVVKPPQLFELDASFGAAVRPVHIRNVGIPPLVPLDAYWQGITSNAGVEDIDRTVDTFVEGERIRAYFNSHAFSIDPSRGLLRRWFERFEALVCDERFQEAACRDQDHQVFLHQAVWSVLLATDPEAKQIRRLPPDYNYPYNLHMSVPVGKRTKALDDVVCFAYEGRSLDPGQINDVDIRDPLRSWLLERVAPDGSPAPSI